MSVSYLPHIKLFVQVIFFSLHSHNHSFFSICQLSGENAMKSQPYRKKHRQCKKLERGRAQRRAHQLVVKCQMFYWKYSCKVTLYRLDWLCSTWNLNCRVEIQRLFLQCTQPWSLLGQWVNSRGPMYLLSFWPFILSGFFPTSLQLMSFWGSSGLSLLSHSLKWFMDRIMSGIICQTLMSETLL